MTFQPRFPLGDHGEGYCRTCLFVVALNEFGQLVPHERGLHFRKQCDGSLGKPGARTPYASKKGKFVATPKRRACQFCKQDVVVHHPTGLLERHYMPEVKPTRRSRASAPMFPKVCPGSARKPARPTEQW